MRDRVIDYSMSSLTSRRKAMRSLAALSAGSLISSMHPIPASAQTSPIMRVRSINHVHIDVSDILRSADFYAVMFGARVQDKAENFWTMSLPTGTPDFAYWLSLNRAPLPKPSLDGSGVKPGQYAHMGVGVELSDPQASTRISDTLNKRFAFAKAKPTGPWNDKNEFPGARSIYFSDADGLIIQAIRPDDNGFLFAGTRFEGAPAWTPPAEKALVRVRNINHMHFDVSDLDRSASFYRDVFGARIRDKSPTLGYTLLLPTETPGRATWLSLTKAPKEKISIDGSGVKPGQYAHMGIGIDIDDGANSTNNIAAAINKRFPFAKAQPTGPANAAGERPGARSIYMRDPDGLILQLIKPDDDGWYPNSSKAGT